MATPAVLAWALPWGSAGCRAAFLQGAREERRPPANSLAAYRPVRCTSASGEPQPDLPATVYVVQTQHGLELLELGPEGRGLRFQNAWKDNRGYNFVAYEHRQEAWQFALPADLVGAGQRFEFDPLKYEVLESEGVIKLAGEPSSSCQLVPFGPPTPAGPSPAPHPAPAGPPPTPAPAPPTVAPPPAPAGTVAPPAPTVPAPTPPPTAPPPPPPTAPGADKVCVPGTTQRCVGPGACQGGQTCNSDGYGWSPCDCG